MTEPVFVKSSFCNSDGCVEEAQTEDKVLIRDSKLGDASPILKFDENEWQAFRQAIIHDSFQDA